MTTRTAKRLYFNKPLFDKVAEYGQEWSQFKQNNPLTGKRCEECGSKIKLHRHHILPVKKGGKHILSNIKILCEDCHVGKHPHMQRNKKKSVNLD